MPTLLDALADDLLAWPRRSSDGVPRHVVLWLDPTRDLARLAPHLAPIIEQRGSRLLTPAPEEGRGQLALKLDLLRLASSGRGTDAPHAVVYLPGYGLDALEPRPDGSLPVLWALYEYRYTGCVWGRGSKWEPGELPRPCRLYEWLRTRGLELPSDNGRTTRELADGGPESLLARYAELQRDTDPASWPRPLRLDDVRDALAGDPRDVLRELFAAPHHAVHGWIVPSLVLSRLVDEFGLSVPNPLPSDPDGTLDGNALADLFALQLALTEAWDAFGQDEDFPYREQLPRSAVQRGRQVAFVRNDLVSHTRLGPLFWARIERLEPSYPLASWAAGRPGAPVALPVLARQRWQAALAAFTTAASEGLRTCRSWLAEHEADIASGTISPWDEAGIGRWHVLAKLANVCARAQAAHQVADGCREVAQLVRHYTHDWWQVDLLHLETLAACTGVPGLEQVRQIADLALFEYANASSDAFSALVEQDGTWPPAGQSSVDSLRATLWRAKSDRKQAVIISDAFRWDLAQRASARAASQSRTVEVEPVLSTLPSITPFGMAALLPLDRLPPDEAALTVSYEAKAVIKDGAGRTLSTRDGRKALLGAVLRGPKGEPAVRFADMEQLLAGAEIPKAPLVVVFDNDIDQQGHAGGGQFPRLALDLAANIVHTIDRLHEAGVGEVHVVTDHGFLLLPPREVDALGKPELPIRQTERREARWAALKPDVSVDEVFLLPCPLDPQGPALAFPRGVRTFQAAEPYEHGGISLHECVLPHLVSRTVAQPTRVEVQVSVTRDQLTGGTVPVVLSPVVPQTSLWGEVRPTAVQLWVEIAEGPASGRKITDPIVVEVHADSEELRPGLYLREDVGVSLPAG
jgi:PglZ domain-containing protein